MVPTFFPFFFFFKKTLGDHRNLSHSGYAWFRQTQNVFSSPELLEEKSGFVFPPSTLDPTPERSAKAVMRSR